MRVSSQILRGLIAALVVAALVPAAAAARPVDLRSPDAREPGLVASDTDLRSPDAVEAGSQTLRGSNVTDETPSRSSDATDFALTGGALALIVAAGGAAFVAHRRHTVRKSAALSG
jgi:hypothetical protein